MEKFIRYLSHRFSLSVFQSDSQGVIRGVCVCVCVFQASVRCVGI